MNEYRPLTVGRALALVEQDVELASIIGNDFKTQISFCLVGSLIRTGIAG